ncbi:hypothetical protein EDC01DRAFT_788493 [Geopyxis carbonaria]|nr:hypothetical protein EDC01DRAFT_788493 [Geopyxis carbonaria]
MSVQKQLYRQYAALIHRWPADPLRPQMSFQDMLARRAHGYFTPDAPKPGAAHTKAAAAAAADEAAGRPVLPYEEARVGREANVLAALLEDRFKTTYPIGENMTRPKGNPEYYEKLMKELDSAPQRSWLATQLNSWRGYIRFG